MTRDEKIDRAIEANRRAGELFRQMLGEGKSGTDNRYSVTVAGKSLNRNGLCYLSSFAPAAITTEPRLSNQG